MLIPLSHGGVGHCPLVRVEKDNDRIVGRIVGYSNFMSIRGGEFPQDLWSLSTEEDEAKLVRLIQTVKPEIEYPLFQDIKEFPDHTPAILNEWAGRFEFHYFLALHMQRTFVCWRGTGLGDEKSFVLLGDNSIQIYGDQASALYQELESIYQQWVELGKPRMLDYTMEFIPLAGANEPKRGGGSNTWTIDRKFFRQIVRL